MQHCHYTRNTPCTYVSNYLRIRSQQYIVVVRFGSIESRRKRKRSTSKAKTESTPPMRRSSYKGSSKRYECHPCIVLTPSTYRSQTTLRDPLALPSCELPHKEHAAALPALALRSRRVPDGRLGAREPARTRARPIVRLERHGRELTRRADAAAGELAEQRGVAAADAGELTRERRRARVLRRNVRHCAPAACVRWYERCATRGRRRAAVRCREHQLQERERERVSDWALTSRRGRVLTRHSRHQTPPSLSVFAALSSFLPHPGLPSSFLRPLASLPPQMRHAACHREP